MKTHLGSTTFSALRKRLSINYPPALREHNWRAGSLFTIYFSGYQLLHGLQFCRYALQPLPLLLDAWRYRREILVLIRRLRGHFEAVGHAILEVFLEFAQVGELFRCAAAAADELLEIVDVHHDLFREHVRTFGGNERLAAAVDMVHHFEKRIGPREPGNVRSGADRLRIVRRRDDAERNQRSEIGRASCRERV